MRVAGIDCGTNSIRLLIADIDFADSGAVSVQDVERTMTIVRLGQGVDRTGRLDPAAIERTLIATKEIARLCALYKVEGIRFVATSASRDAENRAIFVDGVRDLLGVEPEVISGDEEARLTFLGAMSALNSTQRCVVVDIGGGSTEFIVGESSEVIGAISTDMGSVRVTERFFTESELNSRGGITAGEELRAATAFVDSLLEKADEATAFSDVGCLIGTAGTVTTVTATALGLTSYQPQLIHNSRLATARVIDSCNWLMAASVAERAELGFMPPGRADVIGGGALIWKRIVERMADKGLREVITSEHDILDGIAISVAQRIAAND